MPEIKVKGTDRTLLYADTSPIRDVVKKIEIFSNTDKNVMITGDTGTGKESIARLIHNGSDRRDGPFIAVNCAGLTESLLESQLFGHEKGAYTGADRARKGYFEAAEGGTLFLDEIGEMAPELQKKLLRALEGEVQRVGSTDTIAVKPRIIAATNIDVQEALDKGKLRRDLYHRMAQVEMHIPDLKDRTMDIPLIAQFFTAQEAAKMGGEAPAFSPEALEMLRTYPWPGNVRELKNMVERAVIIARHDMSPTITPEMLEFPKKKTAFSSVDQCSVGSILTRDEIISHMKISQDSGVNRNTIAKYIAEDHSPDTTEKLLFYMFKNRGEQEANTFIKSLLRRVEAHERMNGTRGVQPDE